MFENANFKKAYTENGKIAEETIEQKEFPW